MTELKKALVPILVTTIGAIASISVAWITASYTAKQTTNETINEEANQLSMLITKTQSLEDKVKNLSKKCPNPITQGNFGDVETYSKFHDASNAEFVNLVDVHGSGCLIGGSILGFYFSNFSGGVSYTATLEIDGMEYQYPPADSRNGNNIQAYAQNNNIKNAGVLVLPSVSFRKSLRVKYHYEGGQEVSSYALIMMYE